MSTLFNKLTFLCFCFLFFSCTKYVQNNTKSTTSTSSGSGGSGTTPTTGGSSGSSGSGSSGSGGSGTSGSGGSGSGTGSSGSSTGGSGTSGSGAGGTGSGSGSGQGSGNGTSGSGGGTIGSGGSSSGQKSNLQVLNYIKSISNIKFFSDTILVGGDARFYPVNASSSSKLGFTYGNNSNFNLGTYNLDANTNYTVVYIVKPSGGFDGTLLNNGNRTPANDSAYIRFINLDANTNGFQNFSFESSRDSIYSFNRRYLDNMQDPTLSYFRTIYATNGEIKIKNNSNQVISNYPFKFESNKIYTIFSYTDPLLQKNVIMIGWNN